MDENLSPEDLLALLAAEKRRNSLSQEFAHIGTWEMNMKTGYRHWSDEYKRTHGYDPADPTPSFQEFIADVHPDDRAQFFEAQRRAEPCSFDFRWIRDPENVRVFQHHGLYLRDETGFVEWELGACLDVTDLRRTQAELVAANQELEHIFNSTLIAVAICHLEDGRIYRVNDTFCATFGHDRAWHEGKTIFEYSLPEDLEADLAHLRRLQEGLPELPMRLERYRHADGGVRWCNSLIHRIPHADGEPSLYMEQVVDVTDTLHAEAEAERQRRRAEVAQKAAKLGLWELDIARMTFTGTPECVRLFSLPAQEEFSLEEVLARVHPDDRPLVVGGVSSTTDNSYEVRIVEGDRVLRTLRINSSLAEDDHGHAAMRVGTARDVSVEAATLVALERAEEFFRRAFDTSLIGMFVMELDGPILMVNEAFCAMLGHTHDQLLALAPGEFTHPDDHDADRRALDRLRDGTRTSYSLKKRYLHADGHAVWCEVGVSLMETAHDSSRQLLVQARDITEAVAQEERLHFLADHDPLTGLFNRRAFERRFADAIANGGDRGALLMIDLDSFKWHNDTYGHAVGDAVLVAIADELRSATPPDSIVARMGGDEFLIYVDDHDGAEAIAEDLRLRIAAAADRVSPDAAHPVTASIGVAHAAHDADLRELLLHADSALYDAKERGRNLVVKHG